MSVTAVGTSIDSFLPDDAGAWSQDSHITPLAKTDDVPPVRRHDDPTDRNANEKTRPPTCLWPTYEKADAAWWLNAFHSFALATMTAVNPKSSPRNTESKRDEICYPAAV
jgi:hypothetical protein